MTGPTLATLLASARTVGLAELGEADLQRRADRKYLLTTRQLAALTDELLASFAVLEVGGRIAFTYSSRYLDTPDLLCFRAHQQGRRRRWKARTRLYVESGRCRFEVKLKTGRGDTDKHALLVPTEQHGTVPAQGQALLASLLQDRYQQPPPESLVTRMTTTHQRSTLVAVDGASRLTLDSELSFAGAQGDVARMRADRVLVETKSINGRCTADRLLWSAGIRPVSVSKYCAGVALTDLSQPDQPWRPTLRRHFLAAEAPQVAA